PPGARPDLYVRHNTTVFVNDDAGAHTVARIGFAVTVIRVPKFTEHAREGVSIFHDFNRRDVHNTGHEFLDRGHRGVAPHVRFRAAERRRRPRAAQPGCERQRPRPATPE